MVLRSKGTSHNERRYNDTRGMTTSSEGKRQQTMEHSVSRAVYPQGVPKKHAARVRKRLRSAVFTLVTHSRFWRRRQNLTLHPRGELLTSAQKTTARHPMCKPLLSTNTLVTRRRLFDADVKFSIASNGGIFDVSPKNRPRVIQYDNPFLLYGETPSGSRSRGGFFGKRRNRATQPTQPNP